MRKLYALTALCLQLLFASAQDIHFSQYYASPLTLNPAMTGNINGMFRFAAAYRTQWYTIPTDGALSPYQTIQASFDYGLLRDRLENDGFGVGFSFFNDRAGNGALTTNSVLVSAGYQLTVDRYGRARIGFGIQGGVLMKQVNINKLLFEDQYNEVTGGLDPTWSSGETNFSSKPIVKPDFNFGVMWQHAPTTSFRYYFGGALYHMQSFVKSKASNESFLNDASNFLSVRYVAHAGGEIFLGNGYFSLSPTFLFMLQSNAQQYNVGLGLNYQINDNLDIFGGGWYRVKDAVILNIGAEFYGARVGLSYDVNHSDLRTASRAQGALELSVVYIFRKERGGDIQYEKYCPNF